ncbi:MAG: hypothetical protein QM790_10055 [Nibricoccus sp.]
MSHPPHFLTGDAMTVVSGRFVEALRAAGVENFELFPAVVHCNEENQDFSDYFVLNVIGVFDAVDEAKSKGTVIMPGFDQMPNMVGFDEVVFSAEKLAAEPRMFRIPQDKTMIFVHECVTESLKQHAPPVPERWGIVQRKVEVV